MNDKVKALEAINSVQLATACGGIRKPIMVQGAIVSDAFGPNGGSWRDYARNHPEWGDRDHAGGRPF